MDLNKREAYREKMKAQIEQYEAELDKFRAQAREKAADSKIQAGQNIEYMESRLAKVRESFEDLKKSGQEGFDEARERLEGAWEALTNSSSSSGSCRGCG